MRVAVTGRRLLEWETAATGAARAAGLLSGGPRSFFLEMAASPLAAVLTGILVAAARPSALLSRGARSSSSGPLSPLLAWWLSRAVTPGRAPSPDAEREFFRRIGARDVAITSRRR